MNIKNQQIEKKNQEGFTPLNTAKGNLTGFTIIELIISSLIIIVLTTLAAANFRGHTQRTSILKETERLSSVIRQANISALTGILVDGLRPQGFGVKISECSADCSYILFADKDGDLIYQSEVDSLIQSLGMLDGAVYIDSLSPGGSELNIAFSVPKGEIYFNNSQIDAQASINLKFQNFDYSRILIVNQDSGRIDIE
ncbi:MAG: hypothetical protein ABIJ91_05160 [Candidatus Kuenenbacteria bacterium]